MSFRLLIDGVEDLAIVLIDPAGNVRNWGAVAERLTGFRADEVMGRPLSEVPTAGPEPQRGLEAALARGRWREQGWRTRKDGSRFWADVTVAPLRGPDGALRGYAHTTRDLTKSSRREQELRDDLIRTVESLRRKDELLGLLAHEMRNPLAPIRNSLHLLRRGLDDPRFASDLYEVMDRQVDRLARIVEDVLEISRLARGMVNLEPDRLDLGQLAAQAVDARRGDAARLGVALATIPASLPIWVRGDAARLRRVVNGLLDNALKFTSRGGSVTLRIAADTAGDQAVLSVRDTGTGMTAEALRRILEALARPDGDLGIGRGALGLGLALVHGIIELHGGSVQAHSGGPGLGAEFAIRLPLAEPAVPEQAVVPAGASRLRVLVVEDNIDAAESLRRLLNLHGHEVSVAADGFQGVAEAKRCHPDCVVCDIGLPGMDGYAVASALRRDPETAGARLIAVTGYGRAEDRARALSSGFDEHITKPADPEVLLKKLARSG
ncbi:MAG: hybrid sensor histidine kinase/response regulator [Isosphaeraceae bacterium]